MDMSLKNALFSAGLVNPASAAISSVQKTADTTQDFGAVFDRTAQKIENTKQPSADNSARTDTKQPEKISANTDASEKMSEGTNQDKVTTVDENVSETAAGIEESREGLAVDETLVEEEPVLEEPSGVLSEIDSPVDEMTADEITKVLEQIIEQIKEILGITNEELLNGMEELQLSPYDLLDSDYMSQLVTAVSGEKSVISLVANEELYTALQDITELVDTQVKDLLDKTGLTDQELDAVLQKLHEMESEGPQLTDQNVEAQPQKTEGLTFEATTELAAKKQAADEPVIIREDNTRPDEQPVKKDEALPENQQEDSIEVNAKPQSQGTEKDARDSGEKESKHYEQNHPSQNFQNSLNEVSDTTAAEGIEKFTSQNTENILRQLADMVKIVRNENLTEMELQLHPASLGTVNVSLTTKGGVVTAQFTTQNEAVKAAIEAQASQLRANLEEQGVKIEAIEVSVESHEMERNLDRNGQEQQRQAQEQEIGRVQGMRRGRGSINLNAFTDGEELEGDMQGADDATRIAMEIMAANGNTMDLLA